MSRYNKSTILIDEALKYIPIGSQTFSKSITQYPKGTSPLFIQKAHGSKVWDIDGNEYIDFVSSLACINLGYQDPDVLSAVKKQLEIGTIFSLPGTIELDVARLICDTIPCAEMVRFAKNGSDVTSAAVRIARSYTKRDIVAVCGYHGWHDWYISSTTKNSGIPKAVQDLTLKFEYNNIDSLKALFEANPNAIACVIMEAMNIQYPKDSFLQKVQDLCKQHGSLFVLDEIVTGFRFAPGGAQEEFNITPDLCCLGKGIANGYPLSVITGKAQYMTECDNIFFSGTFGGELLSLAAAKATVQKIKTHNVCKRLCDTGLHLRDVISKLIKDAHLEDTLSLSGHPSWQFLNIKDTVGYDSIVIKTLFLQEIFKRGILFIGAHNINYAHSKDDIHKTASVYQEVFDIIYNAIKTKKVMEILETPPLTPLFKVR